MNDIPRRPDDPSSVDFLVAFFAECCEISIESVLQVGPVAEVVDLQLLSTATVGAGVAVTTQDAGTQLSPVG
jgi:hypothetical protein